MSIFSNLSLNILNTAILFLNKACEVEYLNQSAEQLLGYSCRQIKGENLFSLIRADFDQNTLHQFYQQRQSGFIEEAQIRSAAGLVSSNIMISRIELEQESYLLLEFQSSEHHANIRKDMELQQQNRVSNHLIRNLAHEIKNPLGGIKGAAQLMERKLPSDFSNQYTQIIINEADRLSDLVGRLLLPAEPEEKQSVNAHLLIEKALEITLLQHQSPIKIIKNYDPSLPELLLSPGQIQQSLLNLIKNAAEAIEGESIDRAGEIQLKTRILHQHTIGKVQHKQVIRIDVIDNGVGIPDTLLKDIFFPTISGKNSSGLGLSIAQSLVQRHGGIIEVESKPRHTCFSLYLPLEYNND
ncbi:nitrogen regulation protein NR(II) [Aliikangiella coralliicola]|uniref:Sensory histidine kinase/phosphatase NtrB n=1 Tax=Aliikangiella coralliicola TaxID=2592383 RepID=A0A545UHD3_9GAMM|nr:nitrogen regulation protein NR(II) [Aliikangiella coralliicola]TQV88872.1 PAS domain-containing protein [Aliikangiella coralliicola]